MTSSALFVSIVRTYIYLSQQRRLFRNVCVKLHIFLHRLTCDRPFPLSSKKEERKRVDSTPDNPPPPPPPPPPPLLSLQFSLYFHQVLSEHASVYDMKHLSDMLDADYVTSLFGIIRHTPAVCTTLVFDSTGLPEFKGPKYHCPDSPSPTLTGINAYPFMIKVPHVSLFCFCGAC